MKCWRCGARVTGRYCHICGTKMAKDNVDVDGLKECPRMLTPQEIVVLRQDLRDTIEIARMVKV